jgi:prepilin-type N-terminal cleavage/methylation domain-containing protein
MRAIQSNSNNRSHGWTLIELLVVLAVLAILAATIDWGPSPIAKRKAIQISCLDNLKNIGSAFHVWATDHNGKFPMEVSPSTEAWRTFQLMSNELATPKVLICYGDNQRWPAATNFGPGLKTRISYFIGLDASTNHRAAWLAGDDNFEVNRAPIKTGLAELTTNTPLSWSAARHLRTGNLLLVDGSVQFSGNTNIAQQLSSTGLATNRIAVP